jgi:hypothetical protein
VNGIAQDMFYQETTDSIGGANWFPHYDNSRVFPFSSTINTYPHSSITVTNTKANMLTSSNYTALTPDRSSTQSNYYYAYTTENARQAPVAQDHGTYAIIGGFYQPKQVITSINRANVSSNDPTTATNGATLTGSELAGSTVSGADFTWFPASGDTLYYIADDNTFILGKQNLMAYYAWAASQRHNPTAGDDWLAANPGGTITANAVYGYTPGNGAAFGSAVVDAINQDIADKVLYAYFMGECFYRIFIQNNTASSAAERALVLRNHIYDVNITSIKGPGIANPNEILIPDKPILEQDTYVSVTINVLDWHKVDQDKDVDNE